MFRSHHLHNFMTLPNQYVISTSQVRTFLGHTLNELTHTWIRGIKYSFSVACPCNTLQQKSQQESTETPNPRRSLHFLCLEECFNNKTIQCKGLRVATDCFKRWFHTQVHDEVEQIKKGRLSSFIT